MVVVLVVVMHMLVEASCMDLWGKVLGDASDALEALLRALLLKGRRKAALSKQQ